MDATRLATLLRDLDDDRRSGKDIGRHLCATCVEVLAVSGAGIMLLADGGSQSTLGGSNAVISLVEELQFTMGEGPCIDACRSSQPVLEPDLVDPASNRWPSFSGPAVDAGVRAVFGFPLLSGATSLGALDLYVDEPGDLRPEQLRDAIVLAEVISNAVLALQADARPGRLGKELDRSFTHRAVVHQAAGIMSAQLAINVDDALVRIRAHAYAVNRSVTDVASDIVDHRLRLYRD